MASVLCETMPSKVTDDKSAYFSKGSKTKAKQTEPMISASVRLMSVTTTRVIPSNAPCAKVSPKNAMRRQTTKLPNGPAIKASNKPANKGVIHQGLIMLLSALVVVFMVMMMGVCN